MNYLGVGGKDEKKGRQKAPRKQESCGLDSQLFHNMFLIGVEWRYNVVLISAVQWTYVYPLPLSPSHDSPISSLQVTVEYQTELLVL